MRSTNTTWHSLLLGLLVLGCTSSHTSCPEVAGQCMTACCEARGAPAFDDACNAICPSGSSLIDRCAPAPDCRCTAPDASMPTCTYGPCCDEIGPATLDGDCDWTCPSGATFAHECIPASSCDGCAPDDAGPPPLCLGGSCCTETAAPRLDEECRWVCPGGLSLACTPADGCPPPWLSCDEPADCILAPENGCCFPCGESLSLEQVTAIHREHASAYYESECPGELECPDCIPARNPSLRTTCSAAGQCEVFDVRRLPISACTSDTDCRVRVPDCCECGAVVDPASLIALHVDEVGPYVARVCGPFDGDCAPCAPVYPDTVEAYCAADGHCAVRAAP